MPEVNNRLRTAIIKYEPFKKCSDCGFCYDFCPAYSVAGENTQSDDPEHEDAKGRPESKNGFFQVEKRLSACLLCKACLPSCSTGSTPDEVVLSLREHRLESEGMSLAYRILFRGVLPYPNRIGHAVRFISLMKKLGLDRLAKALDFDTRGLRLADAIMAGTPNACDSTTLSNDAAIESGKTVTYFRSCGFDHFLPEVRLATMNILNNAGYNVEHANNFCCGLLSHANGDTRTARELAKKNINLLESSGMILTECAGCSSFLKKYSDLFAGEPEYEDIAWRFAERVKDSHELIQSDLLMIPQHPVKSSSGNIKVTYHDPCHLNRYQGITEEPRKILSAIPGIEYVELPESDWCCGGPGLYGVTNNDTSTKILRRKVRNIKRTKADVVATACPACIIQLSDGIRREGLKVDVMHVNQLLAQYAAAPAR